MKAIYTAHASSTLGLNGHVTTDDKQISLQLSVPGSGQPGINPEQFLACGYSSCLGMAMNYVSKELGLTLDNFSVDAEVTLYKDDIGFVFKIILNVKLSMDMSEAKKLVEAAHKVCPYSRAMENNLKVITMINSEMIT